MVRFAEPSVPASVPPSGPPGSVVAEDVVRFPLGYADARPRDAEALAVQPGTNRVFVVDKVLGERRMAQLWAAPAELTPDAANALTRLAPVGIPAVTGADFSPDGRLFVVRTETTAYAWPVRDGDVAAAVAEEPTEIPLPEQPQGESVTFTIEGDALLVGSEGRASAVWRVPLPAALLPPTPTSPTPQAADPSRAADAGAGSEHGSVWAVAGAAAVAVAVAAALAVGYLRRRRG